MYHLIHTLVDLEMNKKDICLAESTTTHTKLTNKNIFPN